MRPKNKSSDVYRHINMRGPDTRGRTGADACWPWLGAHNDKGIPYFKLDGKLHVAYRVVLSTVDANFDLHNKHNIARHKCDNKGVSLKTRCCNPYHLEHGTHQENMDDMKDRERHGLSKHTVRYIKKLLVEENPDGTPVFTHKEIADRFGVSRQTVTAIANGTRYGHVEEEEGNDEKDD